MCRERVLPELPRSLRDVGPGTKESQGKTPPPPLKQQQQKEDDHLQNSSQLKSAAVTHSRKSRDGRTDGRTDVNGTTVKEMLARRPTAVLHSHLGQSLSLGLEAR